MKQLKLSTIGQYASYKKDSLLPLVISTLGYNISWVEPAECDILIVGKAVSPIKWIFKKGSCYTLPNRYHSFVTKHINSRYHKPLTLFHTCENRRHDSVSCDYSISFDFSDEQSKHFRLPYWMEMVDWSHEGVVGNTNKRFGQLFRIDQMMQPLGRNFLSKPRKAVLFASHLSEPRKSFYHALQKVMTVDGYGKYFDRTITNHSNSGFYKYNILKDYAFNLCPENKLHPGYYTEKIPEAFLGGCLPLSWTDQNVSVDFNPESFINFHQIDWQNPEQLDNHLNSIKILSAYAEQPLLLKQPSIEPFKAFVQILLHDALSS